MVTTMRLTAAFVASCTRKGRWADGHGLYLQVTPAEGNGQRSKRRGGLRQPTRKVAVSKQWIYRYQIAGRSRAMGLGSVETFTLAEARERARKARQLVADGIDPIDQKHGGIALRKAAEVKRVTFEQVAEAHIAAKGKDWSERHRKDWHASLATYAYPLIGGLPIDTIDTDLVVRVLEANWATRTATMSKLRGRIEEILDRAKVKHQRSGDNPARWKGHLDHVLPARERDVVHLAAAPYAQVPAIMAALRKVEGTAARALEFTTLCAVRSNETLGARWSEIDLDGADGPVWVIPSARMKAGVEFTVALSDEAVELLKALPRIEGEDLVFAGSKAGRPLGHTRMREALQRLPGCAEYTTHGMRSAFSDWAGDETSFERETIEHALAHSVGSKVQRSYRRGDALEKRRDLMSAWARYCGGQPAGKVVPLHKPREAAQIRADLA
jgi:integrase